MERHRVEIDQLLGEIEIPDTIHNGFENLHHQQQLFLQQQQSQQLIDPLETPFSRLSLNPKNGFHHQLQSPFRSSPTSSSSSGGPEDLSPELYGYSLWNYPSPPPPEPEPLSLFQQQVFQKLIQHQNRHPLQHQQPQQQHLQQQQQPRFFENSFGVSSQPLHIPRPAAGPFYNYYLPPASRQLQQLRGGFSLDHSGNRPVCKYFSSGFCSRGENCPYRHPARSFNLGGHHHHQQQQHQQQQQGRVNFQRKMSALEEQQLKSMLSEKVAGDEAAQQQKYESVEALEGRIVAAAKDQHGCRFLQKIFEEGSEEEVGRIFGEVMEALGDLMTDPFGNYLVQKLLEVCSDIQCGQILRVVTRKGELVNISLNMHGTRAVQKLIEILKMPEHILMVTSALRENVVTLINDLNGNHVIQKCLQRLSSENIQFIIDAAAEHCVEIATHRHGCCVLQRCVDYASVEQRHLLVSEIASNALTLSQDQYGNYVVQYVLELGLGWATMEAMMRLEGNFSLLSMQKFSSNVVEKCLKLAGEEFRNVIIRELISSSLLTQLLQDPFANYVVQCALSVAKGCVHAALVEAIKPHVGMLRSSPYGKRILSRANIKK